MESSEDNNLLEQEIALVKILEIGNAQIEQGKVKTMEEVFEELDN